MESKDPKTGLEALGDMSLGTHFCLFYDSEQDLVETLAGYFGAGLARHELCLWITPQSLENAANALERVIPGVNQYLAAGRVEILSCPDWYCDGDHFDAQLALETFDTKLKQARDTGYARLRILSDDSWLTPEDWAAFSEYEGRIDERFAGKPISIVCAYPTDSHTAAQILDIARTHRFIAAKRSGHWEVLEAPELKHIKAESRDDLELRVEERTANLHQMNQALQAEIIEHMQAAKALQASEVRLQTAIDASNLGLWTLDMEKGRLTSLGHHDELFGFAPGEFDGTLASLDKRIHPDDLPEVLRLVQQAREEGSDYKQEYRVIWPDGSIHWLQALGRFVHDERGQPAKMYGALLDITERKRAEEALRKSEQVLREAEALGHTGSWEQDLITGEIFNSEQNPHIFFGDDPTKGAPFEDYAQAVHPEDREYVLQRRMELLEGGPGDIEYRVIWPDGSVHTIFGRATVDRDGTGRAIRIYGTNVDITERKNAENALRQEKELFQAIFDRVPAMIIVQNQEGVIRLANPEFEHATGWSLQEAQRLDMLMAMYPDERTRHDVIESMRRSDGRWKDFQTRIKGGRMIDVSWATVRLSDGSVIAVGKDVTERKEMEEALRENEGKLKQAQELAHVGYWERDILSDRITGSEETSRILGRKPSDEGFSSASLQEMIHPDDRKIQQQALREALAARQVYDVEYRIVRPDGGVRFLHVRDQVVRDQSGRAIRMFGAIQDITERKQTEEAARESQELVRLVLATLPVGVMVGNRDDDIILVNEASKRIWGGVIVPGLERRTQSVGFWHDSGRRIGPTEWASVRALADGETTLNELIDIETFDGQPKTILNSAAPIRNAGGLIIGDVIVNEDISGRVRAEAAMQNQAARAETLGRIAARLNRQLDLDAVVQAVCQEVVDTFKVSQAVMSLYDTQSDLLLYAGGINIAPEDAAAMAPITRSGFDQLLQQPGPIMVVPDIQAVPDVPDSEFNARLDVRTVVTAAMLRDGEFIGVIAVGVNGRVREFTEDELTLLKAISDQAAQAIANAQLLKAANEQQEQLRALSAKLVEAQEEERLAVARDLHDTVGQSLTGLVMQLGSAKNLLPRSAKSARDILEQAEALAQEVMERARSIIHELRPQVLDDLGLIPALQRIGDDFQRSTGVLVEIKTSSFAGRLPPALEVAVFRIVQEALTNVRKHAQARHVRIELAKHGEEVLLSVQDDGIGFEKRALQPRASSDVVIGERDRIPAGHFGLIGIQERATMLDGTLQIITSPGHGTTLRVVLPVPETRESP